ANLTPESLLLDDTDKIAVITLIVVSIFGLVWTIIVSIAVSKQPKSASNVFLLTLCFADGVVCFISLFYSLYDLPQSRFATGRTGCIIHTFLSLWSCWLSVYSLLALTIERYMAIMYQKTISINTAYVWSAVMIIGSMVVQTVILSLNMEDTLFALQPSKLACAVSWWVIDTPHLIIDTIVLGTGVICMSGMIIAYTSIVLRYFQLRKTASEIHYDSFAAKSVPVMEEDKQLTKKERRLLVKAIAMTGWFNICWGPYLVGVIVQMLTRTPVSRQVDAFLNIAVLFNSAFNPVLLYIFDARTKESQQ
ncbi:hypothetical protein EDD86DRAFT_265532, partial [Gorgonomyces haynaldii]